MGEWNLAFSKESLPNVQYFNTNIISHIDSQVSDKIIIFSQILFQNEALGP